MYDADKQETSIPEPVQLQIKWAAELKESDKFLDQFIDRGNKVYDEYLDETSDAQRADVARFNLFHSNVQTLRNALVARIPRPDVSRRFKDGNDRVGRVASTLLERALITELETTGYFDSTAKDIITDFLVPGLGVGWVRYTGNVVPGNEPDQITESQVGELAEAPDASPIIKDEATPTDYVHFADVRYSPARTWNEVRWVARRVYMSQEECSERFGERAEDLKYSVPGDDRKDKDDHAKLLTGTTEVWELWDKPTKRVYWLAKGQTEILDSKDDPLGLPHFFPCPRFLVANATTRKYLPKAPYLLAQTQYRQVNELNARIASLQEAVRVVGLYNGANANLTNLFKGRENQMIPVDKWDMFAQDGGVKGQVEWYPIEQVVGVLNTLTQHREQVKQQIFELTGISDIVRGVTNQYETAAAQGIKAQYASLRLQTMQNEVAEFFAELIRIKAYLMVKFYDPQTLILRAGPMSPADMQLVPQAIQLLKDDRLSNIAIEVSVDTLQLPQHAADKAERAEVLQGLSAMLREMLPASQQMPAATPLFLEMLKFGVSGFRGARDLEGSIDEGIQQFAQQAQQPKPPTPEQQAAQAAAQRDQAKFQLEQQKLQMEMEREKGKFAIEQGKLELEQQKLRLEADRIALERARVEAELRAKREELNLKGEELDLKREVEVAKAAQKQMPTVVQGNLGLEAEALIPVLEQMQQTMVHAVTASAQNTVEAITALANQPVEPAQIVIERNKDGSLKGATIQ